MLGDNPVRSVGLVISLLQTQIKTLTSIIMIADTYT